MLTIIICKEHGIEESLKEDIAHLQRKVAGLNDELYQAKQKAEKLQLAMDVANQERQRLLQDIDALKKQVEDEKDSKAKVRVRVRVRIPKQR